MARAIVLTKSLAAANAAIIAAAQLPVSGTALALVGGGTVKLDSQRRILLTYGNEAIARTLALTGTNDAGAAISETLVVPSGGGGTIAAAQDFLTITSAVPAGGNWSANASLGTNGTGSTPWQVPNQHITPFELALAFNILSGVVTASAEVTEDSVLAPISIYSPGYSQTPPVPLATAWAGMLNLNGADSALVNTLIGGWRPTSTAGSGVAQLTGRQAGIRN